MTDIDAMSRRITDLEYRVRVLEKAAEQKRRQVAWTADLTDFRWCSCGRDICRAPDCPSHAKTDPLGR